MALASCYLWRLLTRCGSRGTVRAGDIDIHYKLYGHGDPVLLLHGGFMMSQTWAPQVPALARDYMVIAMDSRGHGRTSLGSKRMTYRQLGEDAGALIEALGVGPVNIIGTSDGGIAALALAIDRPDLVRSLVLLGTSFNTTNYSPESWRAIHGFLKPRSPALLFMRAVRALLNPERRSWRVFLDRMTEMWLTLPDFTGEELAHIQAPTLVIGCDRDEFLSLSDDPLAVFKATAEAIPHARLTVIPGGTHTVNMDMPAVTNEVIRSFLAELPGGRENGLSPLPGRGRGLP